MTTIRLAHSDDAESLAHLAERAFRHAFTAANVPTDIELYCAKNFAIEIQRREILDPSYVNILAELDGELVGFAQVRLNSANDCVRAERPSEIYRFYVSSNWHGRGVAQNVMSEVLATAARSKADCIWLGVWEKNPRAIAFYGKYGFEVLGDHVFNLGKDRQRDLIMAVETPEYPC